MIKIGLLSDTHGYLDPALQKFFDHCDEIWHAGDVGDVELIHTLEKWKPLRVVFGNIDGREIRLESHSDLLLDIEGLKVWMTHIAGRPGNYAKGITDLLKIHKPGLLICGHSHLLLVKSDPRYKLLYMNPGAAGKHGFHKVRTALRFEIAEGKARNLELIELEPRY